MTDTDDVAPVVREWAEVLGGPAAERVATRRAVDAVIERAVAEPGEVPHRSFAVRLVPLIALRVGRMDVARAVIGDHERGMYDSPERIAAFERRLAAAHPEHGPLQRS